MASLDHQARLDVAAMETGGLMTRYPGGRWGRPEPRTVFYEPALEELATEQVCVLLIK